MGERIERLLTPQDIADIAGVPLGTVYQWRSRGQGPVGMRVGKHVRYRRRDVEKWLDEQRDPRPVG